MRINTQGMTREEADNILGEMNGFQDREQVTELEI